MKRILRVIFAFVFTIISFAAFALDFTAVQNGPWNDGDTWGNSGDAVGVDYPGANDDAYTNGFVVAVTAGATCKNLFVDANTPGGLFFSSAPLTITGSLLGWDAFFATGPSVNVFSGNSNIIFTGINWDGAAFNLFFNEVISYWNSNTPINSATFNLPTGTTFTIDNDQAGSLAIGRLILAGTSSVATSFFNFAISPPDAGIEVAQLINIGSNCSFSSDRPIRRDSDPSSMVLNVAIQGTMISSSYVNAVNFAIGAAGVFETSFSGSDQTQGWWYQGNAPGGTLHASSTVVYNASGNQNVYARTYGNLVLDGSGTKTVANSAGLNIAGSLSILSSSVTLNSAMATGISIGGSLTNDGTWSPVQLITFSSSSIGTIGGSQSTTFNGGITVNKSTGTLTMSTATNINTNISNGIAVTSGTLNLGDVNTTLNGGNVSNSGTITSGTSGTLIIQGTTEFSGTGTYTLRNLNVQSTGDAAFLQDIAFAGNIVNNGSLSFSNSIDVTFNGTGAQSIAGNAFSVFDMVIDKGSSTLSNNTTINLLGTLTVTGGTFAVNGSGSGVFILNSDANGDARIGPMGGGSISGNVTFERYFNNTVVNRYRNFAFPVNGVTVEQLENFFTIVDGSFAWYQESTLGDVDQGWQIQNTGGLANGRAYTAGMYHNQPITISVTGPLFMDLPASPSSPYDYLVTYTDDPAQGPSEDGWNFVANPFASPIDWDAATGWTKLGGIDAAAAIWDAVGGQYQYSNGTWDGIVASGQSFWVHTSSAGTLRSSEAVKVNVADPTFYRKKTIEQKDRLLVKLENDNSYDVAVIQYIDKATQEYDGAFDAYKLPNRIFNLSSLTPEGTNLAVNSSPRSFCTNKFRLNITNIQPGPYKLSFESLISFESLDSLTLYDKFLDKSVRVSEGLVYNFNVTSETASYGADRFELLFAYPDNAGFTPEISQDNRKLVSNIESGNQWLLNGEIIPEETDNILLPMASGEYQVMVSDGTCSVKSEPFKLERIPSRIHPNPATTHFNIDLTDASKDNPPKPGFIHLYSASGQLILKEPFRATDTELSVRLPGMAAGEYIVNLVVGDSKVVAKERLIIK